MRSEGPPPEVEEDDKAEYLWDKAEGEEGLKEGWV
jgi:hypothetical protein